MSTPLAMCIGRLYSNGENEEGDLNYTNAKFVNCNIGGILCFVVDRRLKTK